ncbi:MAG: hypothetical protein ACRENQ_08815 [Gemmatimonadaceae bacterium]
MIGPQPNAPPIAGYSLTLPTEQDAVAALHRVFGADRAPSIWASACRHAVVAVGGVATPARLERVAGALAKLGAAEAAVARSITIRLRTYARLADRAQQPAPGGRS